MEKRLSEVRSPLYDQLRQVRDRSSQGAVEQAYGLIRDIAANNGGDVAMEVTVTLVTAPVPGAGKTTGMLGPKVGEEQGIIEF